MQKPTILVMGVTGSGKTTIGELLAKRLALPFHDADDFHPAANKEKMAKDQPLNDEDREPWLVNLADHIRQWNAGGGAVLACSALKEKYRATLRTGGTVRIVYIQGDKELIAERLKNRPHEYIKNFAHVLDGQFRDLEEPKDAVVVDNELAPGEIVERAVVGLKEMDRA